MSEFKRIDWKCKGVVKVIAMFAVFKILMCGGSEFTCRLHTSVLYSKSLIICMPLLIEAINTVPSTIIQCSNINGQGSSAGPILQSLTAKSTKTFQCQLQNLYNKSLIIGSLVDSAASLHFIGPHCL